MCRLSIHTAPGFYMLEHQYLKGYAPLPLYSTFKLLLQYIIADSCKFLHGKSHQLCIKENYILVRTNFNMYAA